MKWISVKDDLPEDDQSIWAINIDSCATIPTLCYYDKKGGWFDVTECSTIIQMVTTHWLPIPKLLEVKE